MKARDKGNSKLRRRKAQPKSRAKSRKNESAIMKAIGELDRRRKELSKSAVIERKYRKALPVHIKTRDKARTDAGKLSALISFGLYSPKTKPKTKKAKAAQYKTVRALWKEFEKFTTPDYLFVKPKTKNKKQRDELFRRAKHADIQTTKKGLFVKRTGNVTDAEIIPDEVTEFAIKTKREYFDLQGRQRTEEITTPLASADELDVKRDQIRKRFEKVATKIEGKPNHRIRFYVEGKYGSILTFRGNQFNEMWAQLETYRATNAELYGFVNRIQIGIHYPGKRRNKVLTKKEVEYKGKIKKRVNRKNMKREGKR